MSFFLLYYKFLPAKKTEEYIQFQYGTCECSNTFGGIKEGGETTVPRHFFLITAQWQTNRVEEEKHLKAVECFPASTTAASRYPPSCSAYNSQSTTTPIHRNCITLMNVLLSCFHKYGKPAAGDISFLNSVHELKKQDWENINITSDFHPLQAIVRECLSLKRLYLTTREALQEPYLRMPSSLRWERQ